jgi:hypothetical protein
MQHTKQSQTYAKPDQARLDDSPAALLYCYLDEGAGLTGVDAHHVEALLTVVPCPAHVTQHRRTLLHSWAQQQTLSQVFMATRAHACITAQWQSGTVPRLAMLKEVMQRSPCDAGYFCRFPQSHQHDSIVQYPAAQHSGCAMHWQKSACITKLGSPFHDQTRSHTARTPSNRGQQPAIQQGTQPGPLLLGGWSSSAPAEPCC